MLQPSIKAAISKVAAADTKGDQALAEVAAAQENLAEANGKAEVARIECDAALTELANLLAHAAKPPAVQG